MKELPGNKELKPLTLKAPEKVISKSRRKLSTPKKRSDSSKVKMKEATQSKLKIAPKQIDRKRMSAEKDPSSRK